MYNIILKRDMIGTSWGLKVRDIVPEIASDDTLAGLGRRGLIRG